ncbi:MAG: hypothetical protein IJF32_14190, partial [Oscillospiraceae bacterium]|nr:hypothetical protein [Oscillospiraceae bacterium]
MHTGMRGKRSFPFSIDGIMSAIIYPVRARRQKRGGFQRELSKVPFGECTSRQGKDTVNTLMCYYKNSKKLEEKS